jgi:hypothetical protein
MWKIQLTYSREALQGLPSYRILRNTLDIVCFVILSQPNSDRDHIYLYCESLPACQRVTENSRHRQEEMPRTMDDKSTIEATASWPSTLVRNQGFVKPPLLLFLISHQRLELHIAVGVNILCITIGPIPEQRRQTQLYSLGRCSKSGMSTRKSRHASCGHTDAYSAKVRFGISYLYCS